MKEINEDNLNEFLNLYHYLHDSNILNINYDIKEATLEMIIKVFWKGEVKLREDNTYETVNIKLTLLFHDVEKLKVYELFSYDYINDVNIEYVSIDNKKYIKFEDADNLDFLVVSEKLEYEEVPCE